VQKDQKPKSLYDSKAVQSIRVDVRPALDSFTAIVDRLFRMPFNRLLLRREPFTLYSPPPFFAPSTTTQAEYQKVISIQSKLNAVNRNCADLHKQLMLLSDQSEERVKISLAMQRCTAQVACPEIASKLSESITAFQEGKISSDCLEAAYSQMEKCLDDFSLDCTVLSGKR
jgi:hypothetical protein